MFTSPFVTTSIEKIQVGDLYIDPLEFAQIVEMKPKIDEAFAKCPWGGDRVTLSAFGDRALFSKTEMRMGGTRSWLWRRYDATNVIPAPVMSRDHQRGL